MKRSILVLLCALMAVLCLASCDLLNKIPGFGNNEDPEEHTHTYATALSSDATGHWYAATCDCEDAGKKDFVAHVDLTGGLQGGKDGKCDVCAYVTCAHTYATAWSHDAANHWYAVTCGCEIAVEKIAHSYTVDGCACGYMQELDLTEVAVNTEIVFPASAATGFAGWWETLGSVTITIPAPGTYYVSNDAWLHFYSDADLENYVDTITTTTANESVVLYAMSETYGAQPVDKTVSLKVYATGMDIVDRGQAELACGVTYTVTWTAPAAGLYYIYDLESAIIWDDWASDLYYVMPATEAGQEFTFTVLHYDDSEEPSDTFTFDWFVTTADVVDIELDKELDFDIAVDAPNAVKFTPAVTGKYQIAGTVDNVIFGKYVETEYGNYISWGYSNVTNYVLYAGETYIIYVKGDEAEADIEDTITLELLGEIANLVVGDTTITLTDDNCWDGADYIFTATEAGWYTFTAPGMNAYSSENYDFGTGFAIEFEAGATFVINFYADAAGEYTVTVEYSATEPEYEIEYDDAFVVDGTAIFNVPADNSLFIPFTFSVPGIYTFVVYSENGVVATLTGMQSADYSQDMIVVVTADDLADTDSITVTYQVTTADGTGGAVMVGVYYAEEQPDDGDEDEADYGEYVKDIVVTVTDNNLMVYIDSYEFTAIKAGDYAFIVPEGLGFWIDGADAPSIDYNVTSGGAVVVTIQAGETFRFSVGAATKGEFTIELYADEPSSNGGDQGGGNIPTGNAALEIGSAQINAANKVYEYTAPTAGTLTLTQGFVIQGDVTITYTVNGGDAVTLVPQTATDVVLAKGDVVVITIVAVGYSSITADWAASAGSDDDDEPAGLAGSYTATDMWQNSFTVVITEDTITFTPPFSNEIVVTYTYENGIVTLYADGNEITNPGAMSLTIVDGVITGMMYNMTSYTITAAGAGDDDDSASLAGSYTAADMRGNSFAVVITEDTITFTPPFSNEIVVTYTYENGIVTLYADGNEITNPGAMSLTISGGVLVGMTYNMTSYNVTAGNGGGTANEPDGTELHPYEMAVPGTIAVDYVGSGVVWYTFTATADATVVATFEILDTWLQVYSTTEQVLYAYEQLSYTFNIVAGETYSVGIGTWSEQRPAEILNVTFAIADGDDNDDNDDEALVLVMGDNTVTLTDAEAVDGKYYTFVVEVANTYTFASNDVLATIQNSNGMMVGRVSAYLEAGTYTIVLVNVSEEGGTFTLTVSVPAADDDEGTEDNPIVIDELPLEVTFTGEHNKYYSFTATEDCSIAVAGDDGYFMLYIDGEADYSDVAYVKAGSVVVINFYIYSWDVEDGKEYSYTVELGEYAEVGDFSRPNFMYQGDEFTCYYPGGNNPEKFVWFAANIYANGVFVINFADRVNAFVGTDPENMVAIMAPMTEIPVSEGDTLYLKIQPMSLAEAEITFTTDWVSLPGTSIDNPLAAVDGANAFDIPAGAYELFFAYTPAANGTITINFEGIALQYYNNAIWWWDDAVSGQTFDVYAGTAFEIYVPNWAEGATQVSFEIVFEEAEAVVIEGDPIASLDFVAPTIASLFANSEVQTYTAAAGAYIIDVAGLGELVKTYVQIYDAENDSWIKLNDVSPYTITLAAETGLQFRVQAWSAADAGKEITINIYAA